MSIKFSKALSLFLAAAIASTSMAGCSTPSSGTGTAASGTSALKDDGKPVDLTMFSSVANYQGELKGWGAKVLKDKFNVTVNIIAPNVAGGGDTLYQTRSTSGNLGDIIMLQQNQVAKTIKAGLFYDMSSNGMLDTYGKDIKKYQKALKKGQDLYQTGSKIFVVPGSCSNQSPTVPSAPMGLMNCLFTRYDYYLGIGSPKINTTDDMVNMLSAMMAKYPTAENGKKIYAASLYKDWDYFNMNECTGLGLIYGWSTNNFVEYNNDATQVRSILDKDSYYMKCLRLYYELNKKGMVDPDSPAQNYATVTDKYGKGQILLGWWAYTGLAQYNTNAHLTAGKGFGMVPVSGEKVVCTGCNPYGNNQFAGIGSTCKNPARAMKVLDFLYSPEGMETLDNGVKGLYWTVKDGKNVKTDWARNAVGETKVPDNYGGGTNSSGALNQINFWGLNDGDNDPNTNEPYVSLEWSSELARPKDAFTTSWIKANGGYSDSLKYTEAKKEVAVIPGNDYVNSTENDSMKAMENQIGNIIKQDSWKMAFASSDAQFDSLYKDMVSQANGLGMDQVLAFYKKDTEGLAKAIAEATKG